MVYVALLRGINVGGNRKVEMPRLRATFEGLGLTRVKTYINTGNVIFHDDSRSPDALVSMLEQAIEQEFGFAVKVLLRDRPAIETTVRALPDSWVNNDTMKCDVMFLWEQADQPQVLERLRIKPEIEDVVYVPGAVIWRVDRTHLTRSGLMELVGTPLYKLMTVRNCNTARRLAALMAETGGP